MNSTAKTRSGCTQLMMRDAPEPRSAPRSVNPERIRDHLRAFARIGYATDGGMRRLAFSRAEHRARQLLWHHLTTLGLEPRIDAIGNVFGRLRGRQDEAASVLVGSHLDTVPGGGRFDGAVGVVAALEIAAVLRDANWRPAAPFEVVSFAGEESSRFGRGTLGSGVMAGVWDARDVVDLRDAHGVTLGQELRRAGLDPAHAGDARRAAGTIAAFLELHIEQGRVLEDSGARVGIVTAIAAPTRFRLALTGRADHSGATPMGMRQDALTGAAEVILAIERNATAVPGVVGTVGTVRLEPGAINVVPGRVELGIDVRGADAEAKALAIGAMRREIDRIASSRGLRAELVVTSHEDPVPLDAGLAGRLETLCATRDIPARRLVSGSGHDAMQVARLGPSAMLMLPSRAGISHNPLEWTDLDDIVRGTQVLLDLVLELTGDGAQRSDIVDAVQG